MTKLLVSVRDHGESQLARRGRADIVDLKEPRRGPLGAVAHSVAGQVSQSWKDTALLSIALGELSDWSFEWQQLYPLDRFQYAKIGLAAMAARDWKRTWFAWMASLPTATRAVAVVYADWQRNAAPPPTEFIPYALQVGCRTFLVDTFEKCQGGLLDHVTPSQLARWVRQVASRSGMLVAAGGLSLADLPAIVRTGVAAVGVRGGICENGRDSPISVRRLQQWRELLDDRSWRESGDQGDVETA